MSPNHVIPKIPSVMSAVIGKLAKIMNMLMLLKKGDFKWKVMYEKVKRPVKTPLSPS
jgi:hypothetical protein